MINFLKNLVRNLFRLIKLDVRIISPTSSADVQLLTMINIHNINTILDVGANTGQFGEMLREVGYRDRLISFEPLTSARRTLLEKSQNDLNWIIAPQGAIGEKNGEIELNIAGNLASSSILGMLEAHSVAAPQSVYVGKETVPLRTLDNLAAEYIKSDTILFIKIDTQGYEDRVLQGASEMLSKAVGLQLELSLVPLYEGQLLFDEIMKKILALGFKLWNIEPVFIDPNSGRLMQVDATFFR